MSHPNSVHLQFSSLTECSEADFPFPSRHVCVLGYHGVIAHWHHSGFIYLFLTTEGQRDSSPDILLLYKDNMASVIAYLHIQQTQFSENSCLMLLETG